MSTVHKRASNESSLSAQSNDADNILRRMRFGALLGVVVASCFLAGAGWGAWSLGKRLYLRERGIEVQGTVENIVYHPINYGKGGRKIEDVTVQYAFKSISGETISDSIYRARSQVPDLARGRPLQVLYAERWPQLNLPLAGFEMVHFASIMLQCLAAFVVCALMSRHFWRRRNDALARDTATKSNPAG
jgi:hypothetical protein